MGVNLAIRRLLVGLGATFLVIGCAAGGTPSTSAPEPSMPTAAPSAVPSATPSVTPVPTASASSSTTGCVALNIDYAPDARGKAGDPVDLAKAVIAGLRAGDLVERGDPTELGSAVRIVRAGETIGNLTYVSDAKGRWLLVGGTLCGGLGVKS